MSFGMTYHSLFLSYLFLVYFCYFAISFASLLFLINIIILTSYSYPLLGLLLRY